MTRIAPYLIGGLAAVLAMEYMPSATRYLGDAHAAGWRMPSEPAAAVKGDRAAPVRAAQSGAHIATVELVGVRDTAIVYRDRDGREIYRTDPVANVTIVSKGLNLPEVTVREHANNGVRPAVTPVRTIDESRDLQRDPSSERTRPASPKKPSAMPVGCESAFSPVASPAMAHHMGRCMAAIDMPVRMARVSG
jgi:hypothetical protein